jgi:hypothetical protein
MASPMKNVPHPSRQGRPGGGSSEQVIARHAPKARLRPAFSMQADQERQTMDRVDAWLRSAPATNN